jgi:hypothetical protein
MAISIVPKPPSAEPTKNKTQFKFWMSQEQANQLQELAMVTHELDRLTEESDIEPPPHYIIHLISEKLFSLTEELGKQYQAKGDAE